MENKIFIAALTKIVKKERQASQLEVAAETCISQSAISGYIKERTTPNPSYKKAILTALQRVLDITEKDIEEIGRQQLYPEPTHSKTLTAEEIKEIIDGKFDEKYQKNDLKNQQWSNHEKLLKNFQDKEKAYLINKDLVELEKLDSTALDGIHDYVKFQLSKLKKKTFIVIPPCYSYGA